ncbi:MAG: hypothetical protein ACTS53_01390 [Candidatus Hodgkinia cicadicola]
MSPLPPSLYQRYWRELRQAAGNKFPLRPCGSWWIAPSLPPINRKEWERRVRKKSYITQNLHF